MMLAAALAIAAIIALGVSLAWRSNDQRALAHVARKNCEAIEALKDAVRPEPFNAAETRSLLADIGVDPNSDQGRRILESAERNNARERRALAPSQC
jgi:hypothetical protein